MPRIASRTGMPRAMKDIEVGLRRLTTGLRGLVRQVEAGGGNGKPARRRTVTPALRLQGRYMGLIRTLPKKKKQRVMALRASKGVNEAIRLARQLRA